MTLSEFERVVRDAALASPICGIPVVRRLTPSAITLRIDVAEGGFIEAFYNEQTGTTAYALIQDDRRVFGADNAGGWHLHPFHDPESHSPLPEEISFLDFLSMIETNRHAREKDQ